MAAEDIVLSKQLITDTTQYRQLIGDEAYKALKSLGLNYVQINEKSQVVALSAENMYINEYYVYLRT